MAFLEKRDIYIMGSYHHLFRYKIGISNQTKRRRKEIKVSGVRGVFVILNVRIFFAHSIEQTLHFIYTMLGLKARMRGSGKTEWFWMLFPITPILLISIIWLIQEVFWIFVIVFGLYWFNLMNTQ